MRKTLAAFLLFIPLFGLCLMTFDLKTYEHHQLKLSSICTSSLTTHVLETLGLSPYQTIHPQTGVIATFWYWKPSESSNSAASARTTTGYAHANAAQTHDATLEDLSADKYQQFLYRLETHFQDSLQPIKYWIDDLSKRLSIALALGVIRFAIGLPLILILLIVTLAAATEAQVRRQLARLRFEPHDPIQFHCNTMLFSIQLVPLILLPWLPTTWVDGLLPLMILSLWIWPALMIRYRRS